VFDPTKGILLNEPSAVAIDNYNGEVVAVGHQAIKLLGREPRGIEVHRPIRCGTILNFEVTQKMLRSFLYRVMDGYRRGHFVVGIPGSATTVEQRSIVDAAKDAGGSRIDLVDEGLAAGLGAGLDFEDERAHLIVDIGGGTTNIAIVASGGVVSSVSLPAAGNAMDDAIRDFVRSRYCVQIGEITAETIKKDVGAVVGKEESEDVDEYEVVGKHLLDGSACAVQSEIVTGVRRLIEEAQPEAVADIYYSGIILTGGGALLKGMRERLRSELKLRVTMPEDPKVTVVLGAGRLLAAPEKLRRGAIRQDLPVWQASEELVVTY
jgi:rod shape-determining protein MreB